VGTEADGGAVGVALAHPEATIEKAATTATNGREIIAVEYRIGLVEST